ncbi:oxidoreductase [Tamlana sp. 2201CG12-4]|uniref:oxidoreductase n=1 Tax=Tamlana sp. 2201CG12-4 TaxID=3112582 RepID=UPI002DBF1CED|nr:oxidoreductase [Tamlana sp. 2201CG12-4]MEC3908899.1 oxidoreductase [Tamlana sp. 2201CG12-4]
MNKWTSENIPNQQGSVAIITGGNVGLGFEIAKQLANKNATIIIACRTVSKGEKAIKDIETQLNKSINANIIPLDLTDFDSVRAFTEIFKSKYNRLDLLINNAGVVNLKEKGITKDGLEMHMATNHYGHFALTGLLFDLICKTTNARVVTMSSGGHKYGNIDFNDVNWEKRKYHRVNSYGDSKLANLLFVRSLQEKFNGQKTNAISVAAHPGLSATERQQTIGIGGWLTKVLAQPVWKGALPALRAATDSKVKPIEYYGPKYGMFGYPKLAKMDKKTFDKAVANKLWKLSEEITNVTFNR